MSITDITDEQLRALYGWLDAIPLSRPKRNIARDFSDGVLLAEVVAIYLPHLVELHNYAPASSMKQKIYNYETLNQRVLRKLGFVIPRPVIEDIVNCKPLAIEGVINNLQLNIAKYRKKQEMQSSPRGEFSPVNKQVHQAEAPHGNFQSQEPIATDQVNKEILFDKERQIRDLQETVETLELKIAKLEQLVRLKDNKIQKLMGMNK